MKNRNCPKLLKAYRKNKIRPEEKKWIEKHWRKAYCDHSFKKAVYKQWIKWVEKPDVTYERTKQLLVKIHREIEFRELLRQSEKTNRFLKKQKPVAALVSLFILSLQLISI